MITFSRRNGYNQSNLQLECASDTLKNRILSRFFKEEYEYDNPVFWDHYSTGIENMMIELGIPYEFPNTSKARERNFEKLKKSIIESKEWYLIFDFIEVYFGISDEDKADMMQKEFNHILEDEVSAYRIVDKMVVPITNEMELDTIKSAKETEYDAVNNHISKALSLYADRKKPDYENSIKESISAVESICCIITGQTGAGATLGKTIKKLRDKGIYIHSAMENAFSSLYGYASDEDGIRHGGIDFSNAPAEDAKFMLVTCSAFVNYLIEKWSKVSKQES